MLQVPPLHPLLQTEGQLVQTPLWQRVPAPHVIHSLMGFCVHVAVPLHDWVMQAVFPQVMDVPLPHTPVNEHVSPCVHGLPSSHDAPVCGVIVQVAVPLQVRIMQASLVQVTGMPTHVPELLQVSPEVHWLLSEQGVPVCTVWVHVAVPLHMRVMH
jgi:hypothetical protein